VTWLLIPAADRDKARAVLSRIDAILGYPRTLAEAEIVRIGQASQSAPAPRTETQTAVFVHASDAGVTQLRGAVAIQVDDVIDALRERRVTLDGTRKRIREWIADQGWEVRADLPGVIERWSQVAPRDGGTGSTTGEPIAADPEDPS